MRSVVAKNINSLIPDSALPSFVRKNEKLNLRRFKKMIWCKLNWRERTKASARIRQEV